LECSVKWKCKFKNGSLMIGIKPVATESTLSQVVKYV
jgi:hypothetical protein